MVSRILDEIGLLLGFYYVVDVRIALVLVVHGWFWFGVEKSKVVQRTEQTTRETTPETVLSKLVTAAAAGQATAAGVDRTNTPAAALTVWMPCSVMLYRCSDLAETSKCVINPLFSLFLVYFHRFFIDIGLDLLLEYLIWFSELKILRFGPSE